MYRVYSKTGDKIVNCKLHDIVRGNKEYILIKFINCGDIMFINSKYSANMCRECIYINECTSYAIYTKKMRITLSEFEEDEHDYILALYDKNIAELFQYLKKRHKNIREYTHDAAEHTRPIIRVKSAQPVFEFKHDEVDALIKD